MIDQLAFDVAWLGAEQGSSAERASFGALTVRADDTALTRVLDLIAQTLRDSVRVSSHHLACWLADNWWRLRYEPARSESKPPVAWRMAHDMGAAGGGYVWPAMRFTSDGETMLLQVRRTHALHTVQYLDAHDVVCSVGTFERAVDDFLEVVLARLSNLNCDDTGLSTLWRSVLDERRDPEAAAFRRREAMLGLDPGDSDDESLEALFRVGAWVGPGALDETLAATDMGRADALFDQLGVLRDRAAPVLDAQRVIDAAHGWSPGSAALEPWQRGASLARHFRMAWGLGTQPITDEFLDELLGVANIHADALAGTPGAPVVAFKKDDTHLTPALKPSRYRASRRFAVARLLADIAVAVEDDAMFPLTDCRTARQKLQRSAAQEFLCPIDALEGHLSLTGPDGPAALDEDAIEDAAKHFDVSPLLIETTLVNKGYAPRSLLSRA